MESVPASNPLLAMLTTFQTLYAWLQEQTVPLTNIDSWFQQVELALTPKSSTRITNGRRKVVRQDAENQFLAWVRDHYKDIAACQNRLTYSGRHILHHAFGYTLAYAVAHAIYTWEPVHISKATRAWLAATYPHEDLRVHAVERTGSAWQVTLVAGPNDIKEKPPLYAGYLLLDAAACVTHVAVILP